MIMIIINNQFNARMFMKKLEIVIVIVKTLDHDNLSDQTMQQYF